MAAFIFWLSLGTIVFTYFGYSLVLLAAGTIVRRVPRRAPIEPTVTILITAYNEERDIGRKLEQTLKLDYPRDKLEVIVASDGSTDKTDDIVRGFADRGVRLLRVEGRVGKTETQNRAVLAASGEILVFSDATTLFEPQSIRMLVRNYADPQVGGISGRYRYVNDTGAAIGIGSRLFAAYDNMIRDAQTRIKTITGCSGCMYSVRRNLYVPLPADIISDFCEPLKVVEAGYRVVFEKEAVAYEVTTSKVKQEFAMRVRVIVRGVRGLVFMRTLLNPVRDPYVATQLLVHKVFRWLVPVFLMVLLGANLFLLDGAFYRWFLAAQLVFYATALLGLVAERHGTRLGPLAVPLFFVTINAASLVAMWRVLRGHRAVTWNTVRQ